MDAAATPLEPIPKPELLDPNRPLSNLRSPEPGTNDRPESELPVAALHDSCAYANQLWDHLDTVRHYLLTSLPPDPHTTPAPATMGAAPTSPQDDPGWQHWIDTFAAVTSILCGPHGDSGYGLSQAQHEAHLRRTRSQVDAPESAVPAALRADVPTTLTSPDAGRPSPAAHQTADDSIQAHTNRTRQVARIGGLTILIALGLRGLRCRPRRAAGTTL